MAANGDVESQAISRDGLRQKLITSSTKRRIAELSALQHQVADDCECGKKKRQWVQKKESRG